MGTYQNREISIFTARNRANNCKTITDYIELALETNHNGYQLEELVRVMKLLGWKTSSMCACMVVNQTIYSHMGSWRRPKNMGHNRTKIRRDDNGLERYYIHSKFVPVHGIEPRYINPLSAVA